MFCPRCAIALFALLVIFAVAMLPAQAADQPRFAATAPAQSLPPLAIEDADGRPVSLDRFHGRYVLLNLWATWCVPCAAEMPDLAALHGKLDKHKFAVVALDEDHDGRAAVPMFFKQRGIRLPVYVDANGHAPVALGLHGLPTTLLLDPTGREIARLTGAADWDSPRIIDWLRAEARRPIQDTADRN